MHDDEPGWLQRNLAGVIATAVICTAIATAVHLARNVGDAKPTLKQVQQVTLLKPPPPPPPPEQPKPAVEEHKIAEPEMIKPMEAVKELPPAPDLPPPPGPLGLDAAGTGPGDAYGLVGQPGGRALGEAGSGGDGGGANGPAGWRWYANAVQSEFIEALRTNEKTRYADFARTQLAVWATPDGRISKIRLYQSTGNPEVDAAIEQEIPRLVVLRQPPPKDMPLPIRFYLSPRTQRQG